MIEDTIVARYIWEPEDLLQGLKDIFPGYEVMICVCSQVDSLRESNWHRIGIPRADWKMENQSARRINRCRYQLNHEEIVTHGSSANVCPERDFRAGQPYLYYETCQWTGKGAPERNRSSACWEELTDVSIASFIRSSKMIQRRNW